MDSMDELRSPSLPTSPAAPIIVFPSPSTLSVLQLLGTIRCPEKPRAAQDQVPERIAFDGVAHDHAEHFGCGVQRECHRSPPLPSSGRPCRTGGLADPQDAVIRT